MQNQELPERLEDLLPAQAQLVNLAARQMIDWLTGYGYQLVIPPLVENINSLLGPESSSTLGNRTLRLTDPLGGKPIGIRADMTPQINRINRQRLAGGIQRLCYCGPTLFTRPANPWDGREQLQLGAELFGEKSATADYEVIMLAVNAFSKCGIDNLVVGLSHAGIIAQLLEGVNNSLATELREALLKHDAEKIRQLASQLDKKISKSLIGLTEAEPVNPQNLKLAPLNLPATSVFASAAKQLKQLGKLLTSCGVKSVVDLAGLSGYEYHNGLTFAIIAGDKIVARGGRYDQPNLVATGFSTDIRGLIDILPAPSRKQKEVFTEAAWHDSKWCQASAELVNKGYQLKLLQTGKKTPTNSLSLSQRNARWQLIKPK